MNPPRGFPSQKHKNRRKAHRIPRDVVQPVIIAGHCVPLIFLFIVSKEFTLSLHEKASLRKFLESWRGKGFTEQEAAHFDVSKLLGKPCMLNIIHKTKLDGNIRADISSVSPIPKGLSCPAPVLFPVLFSVNHFAQVVFDTLPEFLRDKIMSSREYRQLSVPANEVLTPPEHETPIDPDPPLTADEDPDDLPF